jgi:hypothetical protein
MTTALQPCARDSLRLRYPASCEQCAEGGGCLAVEPGVWRTIEAAPNNEYVLVFCPDAEETTQIMICARLVADGDPDPPDWYELNCDIRPNPLDVEPTHWQPLPESPKVTQHERRAP